MQPVQSLEWLSPSVLKTQTGPIDRRPTCSFQNYEFNFQTKSLSKKNTSKSTCVFQNLAFGGKLVFWRWKVDFINPPCPRAPWKTVINTNLSLFCGHEGSSRSFLYWKWLTSVIKRYCVCVCSVIYYFNPPR